MRPCQLPNDRPAKLTFQVGDEFCDTIDDLPKITTKTTNFSVMLQGAGFLAQLTIGPSFSPNLTLIGIAQEQALATFHRVGATFHARKSWRHPFYRGTHPTAAGIAAIVLTMVLIIPGPATLVAHRIAPAHTLDTYMTSMLLTMVTAFFTAERVFARSTVFFRTFPDEAKARDERNSKTRYVLLGAALSGAVTFLGIYLKHKIWP